MSSAPSGGAGPGTPEADPPAPPDTTAGAVDVKNDPEIDDDEAAAVPRGPFLVRALYRHRRLVGLVGGAWFTVVLAGGLWLSTFEARVGLHAFGPETLEAGGPFALRATLRDLRFHRFEPLAGVRVRFLGGEGQVELDADLDDHLGTFVQGVLTAPARAGSYQVELTAETGSGPVLAQVVRQVRPASQPSALPAPARRGRPSVPDEGPLHLDIRPIDGVLPGGALPTRLSVRASHPDGRPAEVDVDLALLGGGSAVPLPSRVRTDAAGLATFAAAPDQPSLLFELRAEGSKAQRRWRPESPQFVADLARRLVAPGDTLDLEIRSLHREAMLFADTWRRGQWIATRALALEGGRGGVPVAIPEMDADPALLWVQVYKDAYLPQAARAGLHLLVTRGNPDTAIRWLATALAEVEPDAPTQAWLRQLGREAVASPALVRDLLGRVAAPDGNPPLLADSGVTAIQTVGHLKSTWQRRFVVALVASGALLSGGLGAVLVSHQRDLGRRWSGAGGDEDGARGTRRGVLADAAAVFAVLAIFLFGLIQLLLHIRW